MGKCAGVETGELDWDLEPLDIVVSGKGLWMGELISHQEESGKEVRREKPREKDIPGSSK